MKALIFSLLLIAGLTITAIATDSFGNRWHSSGEAQYQREYYRKCWFCNGTGRCDDCGGKGITPHSTCTGTGRFAGSKCIGCNGTGQDHCYSCKTSGVCRSCNGAGRN